MVNVVNGVNDLSAELEGQTVAQVRSNVTTALSISESAKARVNGEDVHSTYVLQDGDELEFVKPSGEKGSN